MNVLFFVDSNLLVYRRDLSAGRKQELANEWMRSLWKNGNGRISVQVLNEYYTIVTRKLSPGLPPVEAQDDVRDFFVWKPQTITTELIEDAWKIEKRYRFSFWDSLIVSAAQLAGCHYLLTEDLQDGQKLNDVQVVDPFKKRPDEFNGPGQA